MYEKCMCCSRNHINYIRFNFYTGSFSLQRSSHGWCVDTHFSDIHIIDSNNSGQRISGSISQGQYENISLPPICADPQAHTFQWLWFVWLHNISLDAAT